MCHYGKSGRVGAITGIGRRDEGVIVENNYIACFLVCGGAGRFRARGKPAGEGEVRMDGCERRWSKEMRSGMVDMWVVSYYACFSFYER